MLGKGIRITFRTFSLLIFTTVFIWYSCGCAVVVVYDCFRLKNVVHIYVLKVEWREKKMFNHSSYLSLFSQQRRKKSCCCCCGWLNLILVSLQWFNNVADDENVMNPFSIWCIEFRLFSWSHPGRFTKRLTYLRIALVLYSSSIQILVKRHNKVRKNETNLVVIFTIDPLFLENNTLRDNWNSMMQKPISSSFIWSSHFSRFLSAANGPFGVLSYRFSLALRPAVVDHLLCCIRAGEIKMAKRCNFFHCK